MNYYNIYIDAKQKEVEAGKDLLVYLPHYMKAIREHQDWTQTELAEQLECDPSYISNIERGGHRPKPDGEIVKKIMELYESLDLEAQNEVL